MVIVDTIYQKFKSVSIIVTELFFCVQYETAFGELYTDGGKQINECDEGTVLVNDFTIAIVKMRVGAEGLLFGRLILLLREIHLFPVEIDGYICMFMRFFSDLPLLQRSFEFRSLDEDFEVLYGFWVLDLFSI